MTKSNIKEKVVGKIFIKATVKNISPLAIGSGKDKYSDADIHRNHEGKPMISATALMGSLTKLLNDMSNTYRYLFGYDDKSSETDFGIQSHLVFDDLICTCKDIITYVRDGVKIDGKLNTAIDQGKYDYEILEPNHEFSLNGEITVREGIENNDIDRVLGEIAYLFSEEGNLQVGALTSFGFGQLECSELLTSGLLKGQEYFDYLKQKSSPSKRIDLVKPKVKSTTTFTLDLKPTTPLFIGGGLPNTAEADDASLKSNGKYILSAKSLKGAVRHHAYKIANTVHNEDKAKELCNAIFGFSSQNAKQKDLTKSNLWLSDAILNDTGEAKSQTQVAIDRFTGGAIESALFSTEPAWPKDNTSVKCVWKLNNMVAKNEAAIGLLLLVARDLMTEMLPVGGDKAIGRGRFKGKLDLTISDEENIKDISPDIQDQANLDKLNKYITSFLNYQ